MNTSKVHILSLLAVAASAGYAPALADDRPRLDAPPHVMTMSLTRAGARPIGENPVIVSHTYPNKDTCERAAVMLRDKAQLIYRQATKTHAAAVVLRVRHTCAPQVFEPLIISRVGRFSA